MDGLEKERDFYFDKLRDIEMMMQDREQEGEQSEMSAAIFKILYATAEGFESTDGLGAGAVEETGGGRARRDAGRASERWVNGGRRRDRAAIGGENGGSRIDEKCVEDARSGSGRGRGGAGKDGANGEAPRRANSNHGETQSRATRGKGCATGDSAGGFEQRHS